MEVLPPVAELLVRIRATVGGGGGGSLAGERAGVQRAVGEGLVVTMHAAAAVQGFACILTPFVTPGTQLAAANICLCGADVLRVPAVSGVDLTGLEPRDLVRVSQTFRQTLAGAALWEELSTRGVIKYMPFFN